MVELEPGAVEELALQAEAARGLARRTPCPPAPGWPISPCGRGSGGCGRSRAGPQQRGPRHVLEGLEMGPGAPRAVGAGRHRRAVLRSRPIGASIVPLRDGGRPSTRAQVDAGDLARADLALQRPMDLLRLRDHQQPGGVLVQAVDDSRPPRLPALCAAGRQGLREGAIGVARRRMHHQRRQACRRPVRCSSSYATEYSAGSPRPMSAGTGSSCAIRTTCPSARAWRLGRSDPSTVTRPAAIRRCAAVREPTTFAT